MHIARISHLFYPDIASDYLVEFSIRQLKNGHEVDVLTWKKNGGSSELGIADGLIIHRLPGYNFSIRGAITDYPYLPSLPSKIEKLKPQIVHAESHLFLTTVQALRKAKRLGLPCVVTVHGVMAKRSMIINLAQHRYLQTLGMWIFKNADRIVCLTENDAKEIIEYGCPVERIRVVPNAVDTDRFKPSDSHRDNLIVWVGRFVPEKGIESLVRAAKVVADRIENVEFLLVGYGPLKIKIMKMAEEYGLLNRIMHIRGPLDRNEIAKILGKSELFVFPSLKEGLPLSLLEAMSSGLPVIGSAIPGIGDVITHGENGYLVSPGNPQELANAILALLGDESLRKRLGEKARETIMQFYSWDRVVKAVEKVYNEVAEHAS